MTINKIRYTFNFFGMQFIFRDKKLYRQPYFKNKRAYNEREIKRFKGGYYISGLYVSDNVIKSIVRKENIKETVKNEVPF